MANRFCREFLPLVTLQMSSNGPDELLPEMKKKKKEKNNTNCCSGKLRQVIHFTTKKTGFFDSQVIESCFYNYHL